MEIVNSGALYYRHIDPLPRHSTGWSDCVLHLSTFLQTEGRRRIPDATRDFECLQKNVEQFATWRASQQPGFMMDLVISVNGTIDIQEHLDMLNRINGQMLNPTTRVTVFQRPNIGWQWGGFWDVWLRWKGITCEWWATLENDCHLTDPDWFDVLQALLLTDPGACWVGMHEGWDGVNPNKFGSCQLPPTTWRGPHNEPLDHFESDTLIHSGGGFYFCRRKVLESFDRTFGCFTHALGCHFQLDGIISGEVAFSQKARALGWHYIARRETIEIWDGR